MPLTVMFVLPEPAFKLMERPAPLRLAMLGAPPTTTKTRELEVVAPLATLIGNVPPEAMRLAAMVAVH